MAPDWGPVTVATLIARGALEIGDGYRAKNAELADEGLPFARAGNVSGGFDFRAADRVPPTTLARVGHKISRPGDVVFTSKGTVGRFAFVDGHTEQFVYSPQLCFWRSSDRVQVDPRFMFFWFHGVECSDQLRTLKGQTDMADYVSLRDQRTMTMTLPPIHEQRGIAAVLGALDGKIGSNRRHAASALEVARAIYAEATATVVQSDFGEWAAFHNRRRVPLSARQRLATPGSVPYYGATGSFDTVDRALFDEVLLLIGEDGSVVKPSGGPVTQYIWGPAWVNNHAHVLTGRGVSTEMALLAIEAADVSPWVTGAVQPKLNMRNLKLVGVRVPPPPRRREVEGQIRPLFCSLRGLTDESRTLTAIRDALLPKLVSGQIRVPLSDDPEEGIGAAVEALDAAPA